MLKGKSCSFEIAIVLVVIVAVVFTVWNIGKYYDRLQSAKCSDLNNILLETADESIAAVNQNIKEAKSNLDNLLSMQNFQEPVSSLIKVKYLASTQTLFLSAEQVTYSGMLTPLSQVPLKEKYPADLSKEIFSVCNMLSGDQGSAIDSIINNIYSGKFSRSDFEYLKKLDVLLDRLSRVLNESTVYKESQETFSQLKMIKETLSSLKNKR